jgi:outer membrane biosynthesis protein TonB
MQSLAPGFLKKALRSPTIVAMLGSAGFHGFLVLTSGLGPAEVQPERLQIVNLAPIDAPKTLGSTRSKSKLPVPNELPPINLNNVPKSWKFPETSKLISRSQTFLAETSPASVNLNNIQTMDLPQKSFSELIKPKKGGFTLREGNQFLGEPIKTIASKAKPINTFPISPSAPENPELLPTPLASPQNKPDDLSTKQETQATSTPEPTETIPKESPLPPKPESPSSPIESASSILSSETREVFNQWLQANSLRNIQEIEGQVGPQLTAVYPLEACASQQQGNAVVAAIYGPDGNLTSGSNSTKVLEPAPTPELTQAARVAVSRYHPPVVNKYQAFMFEVEVFYSEAVCKPGP